MELCSITTPFDKFRYNAVPMGIKVSPNFAQLMIKKCWMDSVSRSTWTNSVSKLNGPLTVTW